MRPPVCKACGKAEYGHVCLGSTASAPAADEPKRGGFGPRKRKEVVPDSGRTAAAAHKATPPAESGRGPARAPLLAKPSAPADFEASVRRVMAKTKASRELLRQSELADLAGEIVDRDAVADVPRRFGMSTQLPPGVRTAADLLNAARGPERVTKDGEIIGDGAALTSTSHPKGKSVVGRKRKPKLSPDALVTEEAPPSLVEKIEAQEAAVRKRAPKGTFDRNAWAREHMRRKRAEAKADKEALEAEIAAAWAAAKAKKRGGK